MRNSKTAICTGAALGMLILILDGKTALSGAQIGIDLCIRTLIPSLFPYLALSALLTGTMIGQPTKLLRPIGKLTGIPAGAESLLAVGLLGGYPTGAINVSFAWRRGQIGRRDAERLLPFCNNAGPSFLFGIIAPMFTEMKTVWLLWGTQILSAILVGIITADRSSSAAAKFSREISVTEAVDQAVKTMAMICGWVILFRIIINFLDHWFLYMLPAETQVIASGILELSNGCVQLGAVQNEGLRFVITAVLLSLGGICITVQTASTASGLALKQYFPAKILQCCISFLLSIMLQVTFPYGDQWHCPKITLTLITALSLVLTLYLKRNKKTSSIPGFLGV